MCTRSVRSVKQLTGLLTDLENVDVETSDIIDRELANNYSKHSGSVLKDRMRYNCIHRIDPSTRRLHPYCNQSIQKGMNILCFW